MGTLILAVTALFLYSVGTALQALHLRGKVHSNLAVTTLIGVLALIGHGLSLPRPYTWTAASTSVSSRAPF